MADLAGGRLFFPLVEHTLLVARVVRPADVSKTIYRQGSPLRLPGNRYLGAPPRCPRPGLFVVPIQVHPREQFPTPPD